eukprot:scaffold16285_cov31-Tisochrysis_lutea.AAC.2
MRCAAFQVQPLRPPPAPPLHQFAAEVPLLVAQMSQLSRTRDLGAPAAGRSAHAAAASPAPPALSAPPPPSPPDRRGGG